jgi:hypothetical protein
MHSRRAGANCSQDSAGRQHADVSNRAGAKAGMSGRITIDSRITIDRPDVLAASGQKLMAVLKLHVVLSSNKASEPRCDCLLIGTAGGAHLDDVELQVGQPQVGAPGGHQPLQQLVVHAPHGAHIREPRICLTAGESTLYSSRCSRSRCENMLSRPRSAVWFVLSHLDSAHAVKK